FDRGSYYKPGYVNGISAGMLGVSAVTPILDGDLIADIVTGAHQRALAQAGTGAAGAQATPDQLPSGGALAITLIAATANVPTSSVVLDKWAPEILGPNFGLSSTLTVPQDAGGRATVTYSTDRLSGFGLGSITISGASSLAVTAGANL